MGINWTKLWAGTDDGTIVGGADLGNIQNDLAPVLTSADIGDSVMAYAATSDLVFYENDVVAYDGDAVYSS